MTSKKDISLVLLHGYGESPEKVWFPWIHRLAEERGWRVWAPDLPNPLKPEYSLWMKAVRTKVKTWDRNTIVVGHSLGGVLAVRSLAESGAKIRGLVTVSSPFTATISIRQVISFFEKEMDWAALRRQSRSFVTIHSKNDPIVPYDHSKRYHEVLGSKLVLTAKDSHFIGRQAKAVWDEITEISGK